MEAILFWFWLACYPLCNVSRKTMGGNLPAVAWKAKFFFFGFGLLVILFAMSPEEKLHLRSVQLVPSVFNAVAHRAQKADGDRVYQSTEDHVIGHTS